MSTLEDRLSKIEYHQKLLLRMIQTEEYPAYKLIVHYDLSEAEVHELFHLCEGLSRELEEQKEEGFVHFTPLLTQFVGLLNPKLEPAETIAALLKQNLYSSLMLELKIIIENIDKEA